MQVVGIGEATHGTHEFYQLTARLARFLVTDMGFTAFALESSFSNCEPINDYLLTGKGNLLETITGQGYTCWDTDEFVSLLTWLREHNRHVAVENKVHFYGIDVICYQQVARTAVSAYLKKYTPEKTASTDSLFHVLTDEETKWPTRLDQNVLRDAIVPLHELKNYLRFNKDRLVTISSSKEWENTVRYVETMEEAIFHNIHDLPAPLAASRLARDEYMAQNLFYLMQHERPNTKFIAWAHNDHIEVDTVDYFPGGKTIGFHLRQRLGSKYYALGMICNKGTFTSRLLQSDGYWGALQADTILAFEKSFAWDLSQNGKANLLIDFRPSISDPFIDKWLDSPGKVGNGSWVYKGPNKNFKIQRLKSLFDGVIFIEQSTPSHPTTNALVRSNAKIGF